MRALAAIAIATVCCAARDAAAAREATPSAKPAARSSNAPGASSGPGASARAAAAAPDPSSNAPPGATPALPPALPTAPIDALGSADTAQVERTVAAIAQLPTPDPDTLFAAARACEDKLLDPGRAVAIYERIVAEHPTARIATTAQRRVAALRELVGPHGESATQAAELARLIASADALPPDAVTARGEQLAARAWPGAPTAALWLADWLRRTRRLAEAQDQYAAVVARWPALPQAEAALRGGAGCALEARNWRLAEVLANRLPVVDVAARRLRDDLLAAAARGRRRDRWYVAAWVAIACAFSALLASLAEAVVRTPRGARWGVLRAPIEVIFLAPVALVLIGVAFTAHRLIAPAVTVISAGGLAMSWLSGAALEALRARERSRRLRSIAHVVVCLAGAAAVAYVALTRNDLIDVVIETVRFGPEG